MAGEDTVLHTTPRRSEGQDDIKGLTHPKPSRYNLGSLCQDMNFHTALVFLAAEYCA